jgi:hypothetical protein
MRRWRPDPGSQREPQASSLTFCPLTQYKYGMQPTNERAAIEELARRTLEQLAPEELISFKLVSESYFQEPERALKASATTDDMLGFGASDVVGIARTGDARRGDCRPGARA